MAGAPIYWNRPGATLGRPTKLDDLIAKRVVDAVKRGLPRRTAAKIAGVVPSTLALWLQKGRDGDPAYSDFSDRVKAAEAHGEGEIVDLLRAHAATSWQACAYLLDRRNPRDWAARKPVADEAARPGAISTSTEEMIAQTESVLAALRSTG